MTSGAAPLSRFGNSAMVRSACCAADELAAFVEERDRQPVYLRLGGDRDRQRRVVAQLLDEIAHAGKEAAHVFVVEGVLERQHRAQMPNLAEAGGRRRPDMTRRAVGAHESGEARLDRAIALDQRVVIGIGDFGRVLLVVALVVVRDQLGEPRQLAGGGFLRQRIDGDGLGIDGLSL